jgi:hypothetical protein
MSATSHLNSEHAESWMEDVWSLDRKEKGRSMWRVRIDESLTPPHVVGPHQLECVDLMYEMLSLSRRLRPSADTLETPVSSIPLLFTYQELERGEQLVADDGADKSCLR